MKDSEAPRQEEFPLTNNSGKLRPEDAPVIEPRGGRNVSSRPANRIWTATKWVFGVSACLTAMAGGVVLGAFSKRNLILGHLINGVFDHPYQALVDHNFFVDYTPDKQLPPDKQHAVNVLLMGCDEDYVGTLDKAGYVHYSPVLDSPGRSDALMIAHLDFDAKTIHILSIPRDTKIRIPHHGLNKINAASAIGGAELAKETVNSVFGIPIDYYVMLHFEGFQKVIDALGGIDIDVKKKIDFVDHCAGMNVHLRPGFQHLDGYKALGFVRFRHTDSDIARADRQHEFLQAIRQKATRFETFRKLPDVMNAITDSMKTDLKNDQLLTLANFSRGIPKSNIQVATLPVVEGRSYVYMKVRASAEVVRKMFFADTGAEVAINAPNSDNVVTEGSDRRSSPRTRLVLTADGTPHPHRRRRHRRPQAVPATPVSSGTDSALPASGQGDSNSRSSRDPVQESAPIGTDSGSSGFGTPN